MQQALGQRIRMLRKAKGFSQEGFADACGTHRTYMGILERGEANVSLHNLAKVATTLNLSLAELFTGVEAMAEIETIGTDVERKTNQFIAATERTSSNISKLQKSLKSLKKASSLPPAGITAQNAVKNAAGRGDAVANAGRKAR